MPRPGAARLALLLGLAAAVFARAAGAPERAGAADGREALGRRAEAEERVPEAVDELITPGEIEQAQKAWGESFLQLSAKCRADRAAAGTAAQELVERLYAFDVLGAEVIVRPPQACAKPFRQTIAGVVSSLVGGGEEFPEDTGFACAAWSQVNFDNVGIGVELGQAFATGYSRFVDEEGNETAVEHTIGYVRDGALRVRINVYFASVPFWSAVDDAQNLDITPEEVEQAIQHWGDSIISIGQRYARRWDYQGRTYRFLETAYLYPPRYGPGGEPIERPPGEPPSVIFKPADAARPHFRLSFDSTLSYLVGGESQEFPADSGFALRGWSKFTFTTAGTILQPRHAWAMGDYSFQHSDGVSAVAGQFTIGLVRASAGEDDPALVGEDSEAGRRLRIAALHLSYPHDGASQDWGGAAVEPTLCADGVEEAQRRWARMLMEVCSGYRSAAQLVDNTYAYTFRPTVLKAPDARHPAFRTSREGAISYFAGGDAHFPEDTGFATEAWKSAAFENERVVIGEGQAFAIGSLFLEKAGGGQRRADFIAGFVPDQRGALKMNLMHGAFPNMTAEQANAFRLKDVAAEGQPIERGQVEQSQGLWGAAIIQIGGYHDNVTAARAEARAMVDRLYGFSEGPVLLKPTEADAATRFRITRAGAISYFAGGDPAFPADRGFARRPWSKVRFDNKAMLVDGARATVSGDCYLADPQGIEVELEYTMHYFRDVDGRLRINVHHVSIPYDAAVNSTWDGLATGAAAAAGAIGGALGRLEEGAGSFDPSWILPGLFCLAGVATVLYFGRCWDRHTGRYLESGGMAVVASANLGDDGRAGMYDPYDAKDSYAPAGYYGGAGGSFYDRGYPAQGYPSASAPARSSYYVGDAQGRYGAGRGNPSHRSFRSAGGYDAGHLMAGS